MTVVLLAIAPVQPTYTQGEPLWLDLTLDGPGADQLLDQHTLEDDQLELVVTNGEGERAIDPRHHPRNPTVSNRGGTGAVPRIDLARRAWLPPGTWEVKARLDPRVTGEPTAWVSTRLTVVPVEGPAKAKAIVEALPATWDAQMEPPTTRWDSLGHPVYVPILEPIVEMVAEDRAFRGLAACPCVEATEALFRLFDEVTEPRRWEVGEELLLRAPRPASYVHVSPAFFERAWDEQYDAKLLALGRAALAEAPAEEPGVAFGVQVVHRFGDATDVPRLVAALERTLATPPPGSLAYYTLARLLNTLKKWPEQAAAAATSDPRARLLVDLAAGRDVVQAALETQDPLVAKVACEHAAAELTPGVIAAALRLVGTEAPLLEHRLHRILARPQPAVRDALLAALPSADGHREDALLELLKSQLPAADWLDLVLRHATSPEAVSGVRSLLDCRGGGRAQPKPEEVDAVLAAWRRLEAEQREALARDGRIPVVPGKTDPALVWAGWDCQVDGASWP